MNETTQPAMAGPVEQTVRQHGDGGPAVHDPQEDWRGENGMSLRDYFAAAALQGMLACPVQPQSGVEMYARDAYRLADAMMTERAAGDV